MIKKLLEEKEKWDKYVSDVEKKMKRLPKGKMRCITSNGTYQYFIDGKYVSKKKLDNIKRVCEREYYEKLLPEMKKASSRIGDVIKMYDKNCVDGIYENLSTGRKILLNDAIYKTSDQLVRDFEDIDAKSASNQIGYEIDTDIYTNNGEHVRSKSEKIIADTLQYYGVPYKYELPLELWNGNCIKTIYPDFTVFSKRRLRKVYVEHLGLMDNEEYFTKTMNKLSLYESNDLLIGRDVILFHETGAQPLNTTIVNKYIEEYLL